MRERKPPDESAFWGVRRYQPRLTVDRLQPALVTGSEPHHRGGLPLGDRPLPERSQLRCLLTRPDPLPQAAADAGTPQQPPCSHLHEQPQEGLERAAAEI